MLQSMGSQRVGHDWETELNWTFSLFGVWYSHIQPCCSTTVKIPEHFYHTSRMSQPQTTTDLVSIPIVLPFPELHRKGILLILRVTFSVYGVIFFKVCILFTEQEKNWDSLMGWFSWVLIVPGTCLHYSNLHGILVVHFHGCLLIITTPLGAEPVPFRSISRDLEGDHAHSRQSNI